ncbi:hypothetical protein GI374_05460 [Paracoccus sp. S-4012]|uniref:hypothetical protein n=1 Tax=Paracoccus sp. S-4012 TaxID=2665648 RepID=UPI0012B13CE9|nr:hypothetical protein [Paracoccus sp. S-4012]MRX49908.1 hypothetical protein [Paracoccus sp. S-4012]
MRVGVLCLVVALAGCAEKTVTEMGYEERLELAGEIINRCKAIGLKDNTPELSHCVEAEADKEVYGREIARERARRMGMAISTSMQSYGDSMQQQAAISRARQVQCTHTPGYGGTITTNCY